MKNIKNMLKAATFCLSVISATNLVPGNAKADPTPTQSRAAQYSNLIRKTGLLSGSLIGTSSDGRNCKLTINTHSGEEELSLQALGDEYPLTLNLEREYDVYDFDVKQSRNTLVIERDYSDSVQIFKIKTKGNSVVVTAEYQIVEARTLKCAFSR